MKAHVINGKVVKLIDDDKERFFPPHIQAEFVAASAGVDVDDEWDGVTFTKPPTPLPSQADYEKAIQSMLDAAARSRGYDNIVSACSYAGYSNHFQAEAVAFGTWRSAVWQYCYDQLALVLGGQRVQPKVVEFVAEVEAAVPLVLP